MSQSSYDRKQVENLRAAGKELHKLSLDVGRAIESAAETGDVQSAKDAFAKLQLKTAEYEKLREKLGPAEIFLVKYNVEVYGPHEVSFVLPKGMSRIEMLQEAQALVKDRDLIDPRHLIRWEQDPKFSAVAETTQRIHIDGHVKGGDAKSREEQESFLQAQGLQMPSKADLAAAFVAHYIATREPLFGFYQNNKFTYWVRAAGGALFFDSRLNGIVFISDGNRNADVAVAAALPGIKKA